MRTLLYILFFLVSANIRVFAAEEMTKDSVFIALGFGDCNACKFDMFWIKNLLDEEEIPYKYVVPEVHEMILEELLIKHFDEDVSIESDLLIKNTTLYESLTNGARSVILHNLDGDHIFKGSISQYFMWQERREKLTEHLIIEFDTIWFQKNALKSYILNEAFHVTDSSLWIFHRYSEQIVKLDKSGSKGKPIIPSTSSIVDFLTKQEMDEELVQKIINSKPQFSVNSYQFRPITNTLESIIFMEYSLKRNESTRELLHWSLDPTSGKDELRKYNNIVPDNYRLNPFCGITGNAFYSLDTMSYFKIYDPRFLENAEFDATFDYRIIAELSPSDTGFICDSLMLLKLNPADIKARRFYYSNWTKFLMMDGELYLAYLNYPAIDAVDGSTILDFTNLFAGLEGLEDYQIREIGFYEGNFIYILGTESGQSFLIRIIQNDKGKFEIVQAEELPFENPTFYFDDAGNLLITVVNSKKDIWVLRSKWSDSED